MDRITIKHLEAVVSRINKLTNSPSTYWNEGEGKRTININHFHLDGAYGGYALCRTVNDAGGVTDIFRVGNVSKRELYELMHAFMIGLEFNQQGD